MKALHIVDGRISNIIEVESLESFTPDFGTLAPYEDGLRIGYVNANGVFRQDPVETAREAREKRDTLLKASDIAVLPDRWAVLPSEKQVEWSEYRQALRDITSQSGFPDEIVWPTKPE